MTYVWDTLEFEEIIKAALIRDLKQTHGDARFGCYTTARKNLLENILEEIKRIQPNMTDHGPRHICDVLKNIQELLGESIGEWNNQSKLLSNGKLNGVELYILGLSALFHDVGNVFSRTEHQNQIGHIYDFAMGTNTGNQHDEQKKLVLSICRAHCGEGPDGSKNTLSFVGDSSQLERLEVKPRLLAPLLRFADELAEGEQRTSHFMISQDAYSSDSMSYHKYANCSSVNIDRKNGRICLTYHIKIGDNANNGVSSLKELETLLPFIYKRIEKLNQERQYARYYCFLLEPFKEVSATFNFWHDGREIMCDLDPITFSDLVVPGDPQKSVVERNSKYKEAGLIGRLSDEIQKMRDQNSEDQS